MSRNTSVEEKRRARVLPESTGTVLATQREQAGLTRSFADIFYDFRRSFDDLIMPFFPLSTEPLTSAEAPIKYPAIDIIDNSDCYTIIAEFPGFTKDMVDVQVSNDGVEIGAKLNKEKEAKGKNYLHRERVFSTLQRAIAFPEKVVSEKAEGSMKDGILEIRVPKKEPKPAEKKHKVDLK